MKDNKLEKYLAYVKHIKDRISSIIPAKHIGREEAYKAFLNREYRVVSAKIEELKLAGKEGK